MWLLPQEIIFGQVLSFYPLSEILAPFSDRTVFKLNKGDLVMTYENVEVPAGGEKITIDQGKLQVPDNPIIPFIEGDGTGRDIWRASVRVLDAAVEKAHKGQRKIHWMEVYAGEKAFNRYGSWLPDETITAFNEFLVGIKGPLTTPIGGGIRSLNVALRKALDLFVCQRPVRYYAGYLHRLSIPNTWIWLFFAKIRKTSMPALSSNMALLRISSS